MPSTLLKNDVILSELSGLTWDKFFDHVDQCRSNEFDNDALSISPIASPASTWSTLGVSTLPYKKAACYGFCPTDETESLKVVKCKFCGLIVKVVGYGHHMRLRHQYRPSKHSSASSSGDDCQDFLLSPPHLSMIASTSVGSQNSESQESISNSVNCSRICSPPYYVEQCKDMTLVSPKGVSPQTFIQNYAPSKRKKSTKRKDTAKMLSNKRTNVNVKVEEFSVHGDVFNLRGKEKSHKINCDISNTTDLLSHNVQVFSSDAHDVESRKKMLKKLESANILDNSQRYLSKSNKGHSSYSFPLSPSSASNYSSSSALSDEANASDMTHVDVHAFKPSLDVATSCVRSFLKDRDKGSNEAKKNFMHNNGDNCNSANFGTQKDNLSLRDFGDRKVLPFFRREPITRDNHYMVWFNNVTHLESSSRLKKSENLHNSLTAEKMQLFPSNMSPNFKSGNCNIVKEEISSKRFTVQDSTNFVNANANALPTPGIDVSYSSNGKDLDLDLSSAFNCDDAALMSDAESCNRSAELNDTDAQNIAHIAASLRESSNNYLAAQQQQNFAGVKQRTSHSYQIIPQQNIRNCTMTDNIGSTLLKTQRLSMLDGKANEQELQEDIWNGHLNGSRQFLPCSPSHAEQQSFLVLGETPEQRHQRTMMFRAAQATGSTLLRGKNVSNVASTSASSAMFPAIKKRLYHEANGSDDYKQLIGQQEASSSSLSPTEKSLVKKFRPIVPRQHPNVGKHSQFVNPQAKEATGRCFHKNVYVSDNSIGFGGRQKLLRMPNYKPIAQKRSNTCSTMMRNMPGISTIQSRYYNQNGGLTMQGTILTSSDVNQQFIGKKDNVNISLGNGYESNNVNIGAQLSRTNIPRFLSIGTSRMLMPTTSSHHFTNSVCQSQRVTMGDDEKKMQFSTGSHRNIVDGHMLVLGSNSIDDNAMEGKNDNLINPKRLQPYQYGIEPPPVLEAEGRLSTNPMTGNSTKRHRTSAGVNYFAEETSSNNISAQHSAQSKHGQFLPHPGIPHQFHQRFPSSSSQYRPQHYTMAQKDAETKQYFLAPPTSVGLPQ